MFNICYCDDFEYSEISQNIYSAFYVDINGIAFPDDKWTDFPIAILRMWSESVISNVINKKSSVFNLIFIDGPFSIECSNEQGQIQMRLINNRKKRKIEHEFTISTNNLIQSISQTTQSMISIIDHRDYGEIIDIDELKNLNVILEKYM